MERRAASREIRIFLALLLVSSGIFYVLLALSERTAATWLSSPLPALFMWCPGLSALAARWIASRGIRQLGWRWGGFRYYATAYCLPVVFGLPVYLLLWVSRWADFDPQALGASAARFGLPAGALGYWLVILLNLALVPLSIVGTLGEELGWRGFLVPRLAQLVTPRQTSLLVGVLWSVWHYPLIFLVVPHYLPDLPLAYGVACFTVMVVAISGVYTWLRLRSDSVFPAALLHAMSNSFVFGLDRLTTHHTPYFHNEYGLALAVAIPLVALPFWWWLRPIDEAPRPAGVGRNGAGAAAPAGRS